MGGPAIKLFPHHAAVAEEEEAEAFPILDIYKDLVEEGADIEGRRIEGVSEVPAWLLDRHQLVHNAD